MGHLSNSTETSTETSTKETEELLQSESKDGKLEIVKKIKKINDDGSYTIGYEADDGSFKIESRDVLGHIKGTYGFVDDDGHIKRVSYTTTNSSEIVTAKPVITSVVQRIPIRNRTIYSSTTKPNYIFKTNFSSTASTTPSTTNSVVQSLAKRKITTSSTTQKPNYSEVVTITKPSPKPSFVTYTSAAPRVLLQGRPSPLNRQMPAKSEGQLVRPDVVSVRPTALPFVRNVLLKRLEDEKPVNEESEHETGGNILRRELNQNDQDYNLRDHIYRLQQASGHDQSDVYSNSMTTGHPKPPLFTTTFRPRPLAPSPTPVSSTVSRPSLHYARNIQRNYLQGVDVNDRNYAQETTTVQVQQSTPTPVPVVQIPANRAENQEPLIALRHPSQSATILVPLSQIQGRLVPVENFRESTEDPRQYTYPQQSSQSRTVEIDQQKAIVRRLPPPPLRPIPVQVDENGYIQDLPRQVPAPYPIPVPVTSVAPGIVKVVPNYYADGNINNDIDDIEPPVSTRDFQKLLHHLILRQSKLEKVSALMQHPDPYSSQPTQGLRTVFQLPEPYVLQQIPENQQGALLHYIKQQPPEQTRRHIYMEEDNPQLRAAPQNIYEDQYDSESQRPNRRVARLQPSRPQRQEMQEEYLPSDVREMLLLRMLQLAINPALPVDEADLQLINSSPVKRAPVRNVEILGEEDSALRRPGRSKRYNEGSDDDF